MSLFFRYLQRIAAADSVEGKFFQIIIQNTRFVALNQEKMQRCWRQANIVRIRINGVCVSNMRWDEKTWRRFEQCPRQRSQLGNAHAQRQLKI
jgi:hypothetical protein